MTAIPQTRAPSFEEAFGIAPPPRHHVRAKGPAASDLATLGDNAYPKVLLELEDDRDRKSDMEFAERTAGTARSPLRASLQIVVGFDGSDAAVRALHAAARLIRDRRGSIHIVYVAPMPSSVALSGDEFAMLEHAFHELERELAIASREHLRGIEERWSFERRNGDIAIELLDAASQLSNPERRDEDAMIVVGHPTREFHRRVGSVPVALLRHADAPLLVVVP